MNNVLRVQGNKWIQPDDNDTSAKIKLSKNYKTEVNYKASQLFCPIRSRLSWIQTETFKCFQFAWPINNILLRIERICWSIFWQRGERRKYKRNTETGIESNSTNYSTITSFPLILLPFYHKDSPNICGSWVWGSLDSVYAPLQLSKCDFCV